MPGTGPVRSANAKLKLHWLEGDVVLEQEAVEPPCRSAANAEDPHPFIPHCSLMVAVGEEL